MTTPRLLVDFRSFIPADASSVLWLGRKGVADPQLAAYLRFINPSTRLITATGDEPDAPLPTALDCAIVDLSRRHWGDSTWTRLAERLGPAAPLLVLDPSDSDETGTRLERAGLHVYQQAVPIAPPTQPAVAEKGPAPSLARGWRLWGATRERPTALRLFHVFSPMVAAVNFVRTELPARFLATIPGVEIGLAPRQLPVQDQIIVYQRQMLSFEKGLTAHARARARRAVLVLETDDRPAAWRGFQLHDHLGLRVFHCAQTSTGVLADELRPFLPETAVFPNQLEGLPAHRPLSTPSDSVQVFFGALNREREGRALLPEVNRVLKGCHVPVRVCVVHAREFYEGLETPNKHFVELCDYPTYLGHLRASQIALLPLFDTPFNRCKSDLKFIECAAHGVAALASPTVYADSVVHGSTGLMFANREQFHDHLWHLIHEPELRDRLTRKAREYVANARLMAHQVRARYDWYRSLIERREQLDYELRARAPEIEGLRLESERELQSGVATGS